MPDTAWASAGALGVRCWLGSGAISPWVFGLVLDLGQGAGGVRADAAWVGPGPRWVSARYFGPIATLLGCALPKRAQMAGGKR